MVCSELPFDGDSPTSILECIACCEPVYPKFLTPQLVDLLQKILTKDPESRITIERIKSHPWFSHSEYSQFLRLQFSNDEAWLVQGVDREIVDRISAMGLDTRELVPALLSGQYTEMTAIYSMMRRNSLTDKIRDFMIGLADGAIQTQKEVTTLLSASRQYSNGSRPLLVIPRMPSPKVLRITARPPMLAQPRPPVKLLPSPRRGTNQGVERDGRPVLLVKPRSTSVSKYS
jgi:serine/threonine protein kinase